MLVIVGAIIVVVSVLGGFVALGGHIDVLIQPFEFVIIVGAALGPLPLGIAFDLVGSYTEVLRMLSVLPLACAAIALFLRPPAMLLAQQLRS